jgi:hypothetical protein
MASTDTPPVPVLLPTVRYKHLWTKEEGDEEDGELMVKQEEELTVKQEEELARVQRDPTLGWDVKTAGSLTVGELFWMLGEEGGSSFQLDYTWRLHQDQPSQVSPPTPVLFLLNNFCFSTRRYLNFTAPIPTGDGTEWFAKFWALP